MPNIIIANKNPAEGETWREKLLEEQYNVVAQCAAISEMIDVLMRERVHIVLCAANLVDSASVSVLKAAMDFFPRTKLVVVGMAQKAFVLSSIANVALSKSFESAAARYCNADTPRSFTGDSKAAREQSLEHLLDDNYLSEDEAAKLLSQGFSKAAPGYVIIGVTPDSSYNKVYQALRSFVMPMSVPCVSRLGANKFYIMMQGSPDGELVMETALNIRAKLLESTDAMFSIGISRMRHKAAELYACRKEAQRACDAAYMFGQNSIIHIEYLDPHDIAYIYPEHKEQSLIRATMDGDTGYAFRMLDEVFAALLSCNDLKQSLLNKIVLGIVVRLNIAASSRTPSFENIQLDTLSLKNLLAAKSIDESYDFLRSGIKDFAREMGDFTDVSRDALYYKLTGIKTGGGIDRGYELAKIFNTTVGFMNSAIYSNCNGDIFTFLDGERL